MSLNSLEDSPKIFRLADGKVWLVGAIGYPNGDAMWRVHACVLRSFEMAVNLKASYLFCTKCAQFVSRATYYKHMKLGICPGNEDGEPDVALDDVCPGNEDGEQDVVLQDLNSDIEVDYNDDLAVRANDIYPGPLDNEHSSKTFNDDLENETEVIDEGIDVDSMFELSDERDEAPFCDQEQLEHRSPFHALVHFYTQFSLFFSTEI